MMGVAYESNLVPIKVQQIQAQCTVVSQCVCGMAVEQGMISVHYYMTEESKRSLFLYFNTMSNMLNSCTIKLLTYT